MQLTVVIVNYNVRHFLEQTLLSVRRAVRGMDAEVFVVDNHSQDDSVAMVRAQFPEVQLIANTDNPGFSKANNQAIRLARGRYVLLLNPDTVVGENTFRDCFDFMEKHPEAGGLGVRMIDGSGTFLPESKRGFPSPWVAFCKTFGLAAIFPKSKTFGRYHLGYLSPDSTNPVDVLSGAFMWMRRSVLGEVGLLDEQFFMYGEDIDLSYRIKQGGYENYYFAGTSIIHYKGESTKKGSLNYVRVFYQAMIIFARKHFTGERAWLFVSMLQLAIYFRALMTVGKNFLGSILLPLADAALIFGGMLFLKNFWASNYFQNPDYYPSSFLRVNVPLYIVGWLGATYFSGGYDAPVSIRRLVRGLLIGTVLLAAVYGLLPLELRSSRTLLVLGAVWAITAMVLLRTLTHLFRYGNFGVGQNQRRNLAIVGSTGESDRVRSLLERAGSRANFIGTIAATPTGDAPTTLGNLLELRRLTDLYQLDELIFCAADVPNHRIIDWMSELGPAITYRIVQPGGTSIIGSHSKNSRGELYTLEEQYQLAEATARREKRLFDLGIALAAVPLLPLLLLLPNGRTLLRYWLPVLLGRRTWVGYTQPREELPTLRPAVWSVAGAHETDAATQKRLDYLYARDWRLGSDWRVVRRAFMG